MPARPRVVVISSEFPPHVAGGLGTHVGQMARALQRLARLELVVPAGAGYRQDHGRMVIHQVPAEPGTELTDYWLRFCRAAAEELPASFDLVQCHDWMTVLAGVSAAKRRRIPLVYNVHLPQPGGPNRAIENIGLLHADAVIINSRSVEAELRARNLPIRRMEVIPNGVDLDFFHPAARRPRRDRILFVGRLVQQKGVEVLLRAFAAVLRKRPDAQLVVCGDGELGLALQRLTRQLGIPHHVAFVRWQTGAALLRLYQSACMVVVPSYYEPFGIVALEAMACARPVIASRLGGLEEIVEDGKQGYLFEGGDHLALAGRIMNLFVDPKKRAAMGTAARVRARQFAWSAAARRTAELFRTLKWSPPGTEAASLARRQLVSMRNRQLSRIAAGLLGAAG